MASRSILNNLTYYLDDFLFTCKAGTGDCNTFLQHFVDPTNELGVPLAQEKTDGSSTVLTFLEIKMDKLQTIFRLPWGKLQRLLDLVVTVQVGAKTTLKESQVLLGHLKFACRVVVLGRAFCNNASRTGAHRPYHFI